MKKSMPFEGQGFERERLNSVFHELSEMLGLGVHELPDEIHEGNFDEFCQMIADRIADRSKSLNEKMNDPQYKAPIYQVNRQGPRAAADRLERLEKFFERFQELREQLPIRKYSS